MPFLTTAATAAGKVINTYQRGKQATQWANSYLSQQEDYEARLGQLAEQLDKTGRSYSSNIQNLKQLRSELSLTRKEFIDFSGSIYQAAAGGIGIEKFKALTAQLRELRGHAEGIRLAGVIAKTSAGAVSAAEGATTTQFLRTLAGRSSEERQALMELRRKAQMEGVASRASGYSRARAAVAANIDIVAEFVQKGPLVPFGKSVEDLSKYVDKTTLAFESLMDSLDRFGTILDAAVQGSEFGTPQARGKIAEAMLGMGVGGLSPQQLAVISGAQRGGALQTFSQFNTNPELQRAREDRKFRRELLERQLRQPGVTPERKEELQGSLDVISMETMQDQLKTLSMLQTTLQAGGPKQLQEGFTQQKEEITAPLEEEVEFAKKRIELYGLIGRDMGAITTLQDNISQKEKIFYRSLQGETMVMRAAAEEQKKAINASLQRKDITQEQADQQLRQVELTLQTQVRKLENKAADAAKRAVQESFEVIHKVMFAALDDVEYQIRAGGLGLQGARLRAAEAGGLTPGQAQTIQGRTAALARQQATFLKGTESQDIEDARKAFDKAVVDAGNDLQRIEKARLKFETDRMERLAKTEEALAQARAETAKENVLALETEKRRVEVGTSILEQQLSVAEQMGSTFGVLYQKQTEIVKYKAREVELTRMQLQEMRKDFGEFHPEVQRLTKELAQQQADLFKRSIGLQRDWFDKALGRMFGAENTGSQFQPGITERALFGEHSIFQGMMSRGIITPAQQRAGIRQGILQGLQQPGNAGMGFGVGNPAPGAPGFNAGPITMNPNNPLNKIPLDVEVHVKAAPGLMAEASVKGQRGTV